MYASQSRSTLISGVLHAAVIAAILLVTGVKPPSIPHEPYVLVTPADIIKYKVSIPQSDDAGGGGGARANTPASLGDLPKPSLRPFVPPGVKPENPNPILSFEPAILANPEIAIPKLNLPIGDPHGVSGPQSPGRGKGWGIGDGDGPGVGPGRGPGAGGTDGEGGIAGIPYRYDGAFIQAVSLYHPEPEYSEEARKAKLQGAVLVQIVIDAHGVPQNIQVKRSLGLGLDDRAVETVRKWRFKPATLNGKPVPTAALIEVSFRLL